MDINEAFWSVAELARMAAFIDGEGSINISESNGRYQPRLTITNTDKKVLYWARRTFNSGSVITRKTITSRPPNHKRVSEWIVGYQWGAVILKACLPYFILKRKQAKIYIEFVGLMGNDSLEAFKRQEQLMAEIKELNKRGVEVPNASEHIPIPETDRRANGADDARQGGEPRLRQDPGGNAP